MKFFQCRSLHECEKSGRWWKSLLAIVLTITMIPLLPFGTVPTAFAEGEVETPDVLYLTDLEWIESTSPGTNRIGTDCDGHPASVAGVTDWEHIIGVHPFSLSSAGQISQIVYDIADLDYSCFATYVGRQDNGMTGNHTKMIVLADGVEIGSYATTGGEPAHQLIMEVPGGTEELTLRIEPTDDDWSYDSTLWLETALYKDISLVPVSMSDALIVNGLRDGLQIYNNNLEFSGTSTGLTEIKVYLDDELQDTLTVDPYTVNWQTELSVADVGTYTLRIDGIKDDEIVRSFSYTIERVDSSDVLFLTDLEWIEETRPGSNKIGTDSDGHPASVAGVTDWEHIIGVHPYSLAAGQTSQVVYDIGGLDYPCFATWVGRQDNGMTGNHSKLIVLADGMEIGSYTATGGEPAHQLIMEIPDGTERLTLRIEPTADDWYFDSSLWMESALYKSLELVPTEMPVSLIVSGLYDGLQIVNNSLEISGTSTSLTEIQVYLDGALQATLPADTFNWNTTLSVTDPGTHTLHIDGLKNGEIIKSVSYIIEKTEAQDVLYLTDLPWIEAETTTPGTNRIGTDCDGHQASVAGVTDWEHIIGAHPFSLAAGQTQQIVYDISGLGYTYFETWVGRQDNGMTGNHTKMIVLADGAVIGSYVTTGGDPVKKLMMTIPEGTEKLTLRIEPTEDDWYFDSSLWLESALYKSLSLVPPSLTVNDLNNGAMIFDDSLDLSGTFTGLSEIQVYLDDVLQDTFTLPVETFEWQTVLCIPDPGVHTLRIDGIKDGEVKESISYSIERIDFVPDETIQLNTGATEMTVGRMGSMLAVTSLIDSESGFEWLAGTKEVSFPDKITVNGEDKALTWTYADKTDVTADDIRTIKFNFECAEYGLTLTSTWTAYPDMDAPVKHSLDMKNESGGDITVYKVPTIQLNLKGQADESLELMSIDKGPGIPNNTGPIFDLITDDFTKNISTSVEGGSIPWVGVQGDGHGLYAGLEWPQGYLKIEGKDRLEDAQQFDLTVSGLTDNFYTIIPNGVDYWIPTVFIGCYEGSRDDGSNEMTRWWAAYMQPKNNLKPEYPDTIFGLFASVGRMDTNSKNFFITIDSIKELGFTHVLHDIGWNALDGEFEADPVDWPGGWAQYVQYAHDAGLEFGIYFRALNGMSTKPGSLSSMPGVGSPEWFVSDDLYASIDLGNDEARAVYKAGIEKLIGEDKFDLLRTDFGPVTSTSTRMNRHSNSTDVSYWIARGFYEVLDDLFAEFPDMRWENCSGGGPLKDFMSMQYASRIQSTDRYQPLDVRRTFYDASYTLPSQQILLEYSDFWMGLDQLTLNHDYRFRSGLIGLPKYCIQVPDEDHMTPDELKSFERAVEIYNTWTKYLLRDGKVYHVLPRADGVNWDGIQYMDTNTGKGVLLVFKPTTTENSKTVKLDGLDAGKTYHIWSEDRSVPYAQISGADLMDSGVTFTLDGEYQSEILYIQEVGKDDESITAPGSFVLTSDTNVNVDAGNDVTAAWSAADLAEIYTAVLYDGGAKVAEITTNETTATFNGLKAGVTYTWSVTANNAFGSTNMSGSPQITATGNASLDALAGLTLTGDVAGTGAANAQGVVYLDSLMVQTDDRMLSVNGDKVVTVALDPSAGYKTLAGTLALGENIEGEQAEVTLSTNLGASDTILLNGTDPAHKISLDVAGASVLTITVKNLSDDIIQQTTRMVIPYADSGNAFKDYYRVLNNEASQEYHFSVDVRQNSMGITDATPHYGIFAGYADTNNYVGAYLDFQYNRFTTAVRVGGQSVSVNNIALPDEFNFSTYHNLAVDREGITFKIYLDGELMNTLTANIPASKPGLSANDTLATYKNMTLEGGSFTAETPVGGIWNGLAPTVVFGAAQLFAETYNITYHLDSGINSDSNPSSYIHGVGCTLADPSKDGYAFDGWYDNDSFTGSPVTAISNDQTGDVTLYAKWTANSYAVTIGDEQSLGFNIYKRVITTALSGNTSLEDKYLAIKLTENAGFYSKSWSMVTPATLRGTTVWYAMPGTKVEVWLTDGVPAQVGENMDVNVYSYGVSDVPVQGVLLDKPGILLFTGQTSILNAFVIPYNAGNKAVTWSSGNTSVATVDEYGKVTAVSPGSAVITVTTQAGSKTAICFVTVVPKNPWFNY